MCKPLASDSNAASLVPVIGPGGAVKNPTALAATADPHDAH